MFLSVCMYVSVFEVLSAMQIFSDYKELNVDVESLTKKKKQIIESFFSLTIFMSLLGVAWTKLRLFIPYSLIHQKCLTKWSFDNDIFFRFLLNTIILISIVVKLINKTGIHMSNRV